MQVVRTVLWCLLTALVTGFVWINWSAPQTVRLFPSGDTWWVIDWPVGVIALVFFLAGFVPMWLYSRAALWQLKRRIVTLEAAAKPVSVITPPPPPPPPPEPAPIAPAELGPDA